MAQVQQPPSSSHSARPITPPRSIPITRKPLSPSRMPDNLQTGQSLRTGHFNLDTFSPVNQRGCFEFDRVIKRGKVLRRVKKKGAWKPSWKPAYLVLRPNLVSLYKDVDETELKASITLSDVTAVATVKKSKTDNVFGVFTPAKNYHFAGATEKDTTDWVSWLRYESRTGGDDGMDLPPPGIPQARGDHTASETTDLSADDDFEGPGSPENVQWTVKGNKSRHRAQSTQNAAPNTTTGRKASNLREYSGNEFFTTSQSDLSDNVSTHGPGFSSSLPMSRGSLLPPIPSDGPLQQPSQQPFSQPSFQPSSSQVSTSALQAPNTSTPLQPQDSKPSDPNRVIRQSHISLLKTVSGVKQWKQVWMVLRPSSLALYKSSQEYEPLKIISISSLIDAAEVDPISRSKQHCLQVIGEEKTWRFSLEDERELEGWLGALKSVLARRAQRGRGLSSSQGQSSQSQSQSQSQAQTQFSSQSQAEHTSTPIASRAVPKTTPTNPGTTTVHDQVSVHDGGSSLSTLTTISPPAPAPLPPPSNVLSGPITSSPPSALTPINMSTSPPPQQPLHTINTKQVPVDATLDNVVEGTKDMKVR